MFESIGRFFRNLDWLLILAVLPVTLAGLLTMNSFEGSSVFFNRQIVWLAISFVALFFLSGFDLQILRRTNVLVILFSLTVAMLGSLFFVGHISHGAQSWVRLGSFSFQPADLAKLVLILILAKYFSRRHIEIANFKHILISGLYALVLFTLVLVQPDFGSAIILFFVWFGMVLVSGISKKHLLLVFLVGAISFGGLWFYGFKDYQKQRILTFIHPLTDISGTGYNAYQSTVAVGSGEVLGKGVGFGTQSRLQFLPEYQTDFIFAAFAEEWGFVGVLILLLLYGILIWRILLSAYYGASNFEALYGVGLALLFISHIGINIGMNIGLLPVTGITLPLMSYGGSHLLTTFAGLGILLGMRRFRRSIPRDQSKNEVVGITHFRRAK